MRHALAWADPAAALGHFTLVRDTMGDRGPSRPLADCLCGRSVALSSMGQMAEAVHEARRSLALALELGYLAGQALALAQLGHRERPHRRCPARVRESVQITARTGDRSDLLHGLDCCGHLCAATWCHAKALTLWAAYTTLAGREGYTDPP